MKINIELEVSVEELKELLGEKPKEEKAVETEEPEIGEYSIFFDGECLSWTADPKRNYELLKYHEKYFNDILEVKGYVMLEDVYQALGLPVSEEMLENREFKNMGWRYDKQGKVDFGINDEIDWANRFFAHDAILLDFKVDKVFD